MKITTTRQRLTLVVIGAATIIGAAACGTGGTGTSASATSSTPAGPADASMHPGMDMSTSPMAQSSTPPSMGATGGSAGATSDATIHIKSFAYSGANSVPARSTMTVMNMDNEAHTVTADDGSFNVAVKAGTSITFTAPAKPGTYTYHCTYHSNMHGTLTVK